MAFKEDEVGKIVNDVIDLYLKDRNYEEIKVPQWTNQILEELDIRLCALKKPFKYVSTALIMQRNGAALHSSTSCYWDSTRDGMQVVSWPRIRDNLNKTMYCIVTVFALSILSSG